MKKYVAVAILSVLSIASACATLTPGVIQLTQSEKAQAQKIAEHRQDLQFRINKLTNDYDAALNRLKEEGGEVDIAATQLSFQFEKAHDLDPSAHYILDEWKGELVKQGGPR